MVVYYSLGNFVSNQDEIPRMIGGMAKLTLYKKGDNASIKSYEFEPVVTHKRYGYKEITTYKLSDYTPELASQNKILSDPTCCYTGYSDVYAVLHYLIILHTVQEISQLTTVNNSVRLF